MNLEIVKGIVAVIGLLFFAGCATANGSVFIKWLAQKKSGSTIPLIGGIAGCLGLLIAPWPGVRFYWWVPLILDASFIMYAIGIIRALLKPNDDRKNE
jgi:hypothetical protein